MRDRRWDYLYDVQKQPVREVILEKFAEQLSADLSTWPPASVVWLHDPARPLRADALAVRPRDEVLRLALDLARLDLAREYEAYEQKMRNDRPRAWLGPVEDEAGQLLVSLLTEQCMELKERADGAKLTRPDLVRALDLVERKLFRVTLG